MTNSVCSLCCDNCKEHGERVERDRIIKLLDDLAFIDEMGDVMIGEFKSDVIALIKGENK